MSGQFLSVVRLVVVAVVAAAVVLMVHMWSRSERHWACHRASGTLSHNTLQQKQPVGEKKKKTLQQPRRYGHALAESGMVSPRTKRE